MRGEPSNVRPARDAPLVTPERIVELREKTIFRVLLIVLAVAVVLAILWILRHVVAWIVIALFLALALDPLVRFFERRRLSRALVREWVLLGAKTCVSLIRPYRPEPTDTYEAEGF